MNKMYQESETVHNEISIKEEIKEEKEDFESCSNENNFEKEKHIVAESDWNEETCDKQKVVPLQKTDYFREYLLPFGWKKEFRKRLTGYRWDAYITA